MTDQNGTTPAPTGATPDFCFEEAEEAVLRRELGLRPIFYADADPHPDGRPCPSWCRFEHHDVLASSPLSALHRLDPAPRTMASRYRGRREAGGVLAAAIAVDLTQLGYAGPTIALALDVTRVDGRAHVRPPLNLSVQDARELVTALQHVISVAEGEVR